MLHSIVVRMAAASEIPEASRLLSLSYSAIRRDAQADAFLATLTNGTIDPAGLWLASSPEGEIRGAILTQALDGALGIVWPPGVEAGASREVIEDALVAAACDGLKARGMKVAQWLPRRGDRDGVATLERNGFERVTQLSLWNCELSTTNEIASPPSALEFCSAADAPEFTATLLASYEGSLDCPEACGGRTPAELIAGHGPLPNEPLWFLARDRGTPVGVVLLARGESNLHGELLYLGVVPSARMRGVGRELMRFAFAHSVAIGFHKLTLSVDVRNEPALQLYRTHGFLPYEWRDVYNRVLVDGTKVF